MDILSKIQGGPPAGKRVQRFQLVQRVGGGRYAFVFVSQHRTIESARHAQEQMLEGDRVESEILDLQTGERAEAQE